MPIENELVQRLHRYGIRDIRRCVLLVGAGLSSTGVLPDSTGLPTWFGLTKLMLDDLLDLGLIDSIQHDSLEKFLEENKATNFLDIASMYKKQTDDSEFDNFFRNHLDPAGLRPAIIHEQIAKVGFRAVITTNFDRIIEKAMPDTPTYSYPDFLGRSDVIQTSETFILKIHGSIEPGINLKSRLRLSKEDYEELHGDPRYERTLKSIIAGNPVIAVGYNCQDPDFLSIMSDLRKEHSVGPFVYVLLKTPESKLIGELRDSNIKVIPFDDYADVNELFQYLTQNDQEKHAISAKSNFPNKKSKEIAQGLPRSRIGSLSSGSLAIDVALGTGGWPYSHIIEIYGRSGMGKTSLVMEAIAEAQKSGGAGALIDADHATDPLIAERFGVDIDKLYFTAPYSLEDAWETLDRLISDNLVDVIGIDSIAALLPKDEIDNSLDRSEKNLDNRSLVSSMLKKLKIKLSDRRTVVLITNQVFDVPDIIFGNPENTPFQTEALKYYASIRCELGAVNTIKSDSKSIGRRLRLRITKNRFSAPFTTAEFDLYFDSGIPREQELLRFGLEYGVVKKRGSYYIYKGKRFSQDDTSMINYLKNNPDIFIRLRGDIITNVLTDNPL